MCSEPELGVEPSAIPKPEDYLDSNNDATHTGNLKAAGCVRAGRRAQAALMDRRLRQPCQVLMAQGDQWMFYMGETTALLGEAGGSGHSQLQQLQGSEWRFVSYWHSPPLEMTFSDETVCDAWGLCHPRSWAKNPSLIRDTAAFCGFLATAPTKVLANSLAWPPSRNLAWAPCTHLAPLKRPGLAPLKRPGLW
ncbi:unnamed protein product [Caretta caretta]